LVKGIFQIDKKTYLLIRSQFEDAEAFDGILTPSFVDVLLIESCDKKDYQLTNQDKI
jgi:hypothetical protein